MIGRIDAKPQLEAGISVGPVAGDPVAVKFIAGNERALAAEWSRQGADVALEKDFAQRDTRSRRGVAKRDSAVFNFEPGYGDHVRMRRRCRRRPIERSEEHTSELQSPC